MTTNKTVKTLHDKFMQIDPNIRGKSMIRKSKTLIDSGISNFGAEAGSITGSKKLANCRELKDVNNDKQAIYKFVLSNSIPLGEYRVISPTRFLKIKQDLDKLIEQYNKDIEKLLIAWNQIVIDDQKRLGTLYNVADYPSESELRASFGATVVFRPLPDFSQFSVSGLPNADAIELAKTLNETIESDVMELNADLLKKLLFGSDPDRNDKLGNGLVYTIARLSTSEGFKQNTLDNVKKIAEAVKDLNALDVPTLNQFSDNLIRIFSIDADSIREDKTARNQVVQDAKTELAKIEEAMKGFI